MTKKWLFERGKDYYYRLSKEEGYRSRAAYKLLQASKKHKLVKEGDVVVDLGASPGGWTQAARMIVGEKGYVLAVDLKPMEILPWPNVGFLEENVMNFEDLKNQLKLPRKADVLLSDVSPNISGIHEVDHARQMELAEASLKIATIILRPGGNFLVKVFQGYLLNDFLKDVGKFFEIVKLFKPLASRAKSSEIYVLGLKFGAGT